MSPSPIDPSCALDTTQPQQDLRRDAQGGGLRDGLCRGAVRGRPRDARQRHLRPEPEEQGAWLVESGSECVCVQRDGGGINM